MFSSPADRQRFHASLRLRVDSRSARRGNRIWEVTWVEGPPSPSRPSGSTPPPLKGWRKGACHREFAPFLHPFRGGGVEGAARDGEGEFRADRAKRLSHHECDLTLDDRRAEIMLSRVLI